MIEKINITGGEENIPVNNESYEWWNVGESVAFVMPPEDVLVTPVFKKVQDENDEYYVNLPVVGDKYINVPKGISTIKVYDDGGKDGNHSCKTFGNLYIYPPSGYSFIVSGTVTLPKWGRLNLYGDDKDNQIEIESSNDGQPISIGRHYFDAKDGFRIYFETDSKNAYAGLDMTITLFELNAPHEIRIASSDDGRVTSDCSTAKKGDTVTLTVHPDAQYVLEKMTITGGEDNTPVNNENYGWWNVGETATFVMPPEDVLVTPVFKKPEKMNGVLSAAFYDKNCLNYVMSKNGFMTGGEVWYPEAARVLTLRGAELIVHPTGWDRPEAAKVAAVQRTEENRVHLVSAARLDSASELGSQVVESDEFVPGQPIALMRFPTAWTCRGGFEEQMKVELDLRGSHSKVQGFHLDPVATRQPFIYQPFTRTTEVAAR